MKNFIKYISLACASIFALSACNDDEDIIKLDPSTFVAPKLEEPTSNSLILLEENAANTAMTFNWTNAEYGTTTPPKYELQIDLKGDNFENPKTVTSSFSTTADVSVKDLNLVAIDLGLEPFKEGELEYRIVSTIGTPGAQPLISNVNSLKVTPYPTDLSTNWGIVGDFTDWGGKPDVQFWKTDKTNILVAYIDIVKLNDKGVSEIKFRQDNEWKLDYGANNPSDGKLDKGGKNISLPGLGSYKVTFNLEKLTYNIEKFTWGLAGSATANGWEGPDTKLSYDGKSDSWSTITTVKEGEFKFRLNNKFDEGNFGGADGNLIEKGDNIKIKAGQYKITANFTKKTYTVEAQ